MLAAPVRLLRRWLLGGGSAVLLMAAVGWTVVCIHLFGYTMESRDLLARLPISDDNLTLSLETALGFNNTTTAAPPPYRRPFVPGRTKQVIILAYQRTGSTFFGSSLFGVSPGAFYVYEPLDAVYASVYGTGAGWAVPEEIWHHRNETIREVPSQEHKAISHALMGLLSCQLEALDIQVLAHTFWRQFDKTHSSLKSYIDCIAPQPKGSRKKVNREMCQQKIRRFCPARMGQNQLAQEQCRLHLENITTIYKAMDWEQELKPQKEQPITQQISKTHVNSSAVQSQKAEAVPGGARKLLAAIGEQDNHDDDPDYRYEHGAEDRNGGEDRNEGEPAEPAPNLQKLPEDMGRPHLQDPQDPERGRVGTEYDRRGEYNEQLRDNRQRKKVVMVQKPGRAPRPRQMPVQVVKPAPGQLTVEEQMLAKGREAANAARAAKATPRPPPRRKPGPPKPETYAPLASAEGVKAKKEYEACMTQTHKDILQCLPLMQHVCDSRPLHAIKTVRMGMGSLSHLLEALPNLRIIHLVRDPRGVALSRKGVQWSAGEAGAKDVVTAAKMFCDDAARDLRLRQELEEQYPGAFMQVIYEDFTANPLEMAEKIYNFLDEPVPPAVAKYLKENTRTEAGSRWQDKLTFHEAYDIHKHCQQLFHLVQEPRWLTLV